MNNDESLKVDPPKSCTIFLSFSSRSHARIQSLRWIWKDVKDSSESNWTVQVDNFFTLTPDLDLNVPYFAYVIFFTIFFTRPLPISLLVETVTGVLSSTIQGVQILVVDGWDTDKMSAAWQCPIIPTMWWLEEMEDWCGYGICARISVFEQSKRTAHVLRCGSVLLHSNEFWFNFSHNLKVNIDNFRFEIYTGTCVVSLEK